MKIIKRITFLLSMSLIFTFLNVNTKATAQSTWQTAQELVADSTYDSIVSITNEYWFKYAPNNAYLALKVQDYNALQEEQLIEIASQTASIGGSAVYSARVMLGYNPLSNPNNERNFHITYPIISQDSENEVKATRLPYDI